MSNKSTTERDAEIGRRITLARKAKGLSQTAVGQALGVTFQQVQKYEKGMNRVGGGRLLDIAGLLGCSVSDLVGQEKGAPRLAQFSARALKVAAAFDRIPEGEISKALAAHVEAVAQAVAQ